MKMILELPDTTDVDETEVRKMLAAKLYEDGKLSLGQAAEFAGMLKVAFAEILHKYGVCLINYPISEIRGDAAAI